MAFFFLAWKPIEDNEVNNTGSVLRTWGVSMNRLGFMVWQIRNIGYLPQTIEMCQEIGVQWVSIKFLNGTYPMNRYDEKGNVITSDWRLWETINAFRAAGIKVGGWAFTFPKYSKNQAIAANEMVSKYGLEHWLIDAEHIPALGADWRTNPYAWKEADIYMDNLNMPANVQVALCSYRYPYLHYPFPFGAFVNHPRHNHVSAQVYWAKAHNPGYQVSKTIIEYNKIRVQPHIPIGSAYYEHGWQPTAGEIKEFVTVAESLGCPGWGFWSLDAAYDHPEWLYAMKDANPGTPPPDPDPEPEPEPEPGEYMKLTIVADALNIRSLPSTSGKIYFTATKGEQLEVIEEVKSGSDVWVRCGFKQYAAKVYQGNTYLA